MKMNNDSSNSDRSSSEDVKSAAEFLKDLKQKVRQQPGADNNLLNVLEDHILKENPGENAVEEALREIISEAEERSQGNNDDESDNN